MNEMSWIAAEFEESACGVAADLDHVLRVAARGVGCALLSVLVVRLSPEGIERFGFLRWCGQVGPDGVFARITDGVTGGLIELRDEEGVELWHRLPKGFSRYTALPSGVWWVFQPDQQELAELLQAAIPLLPQTGEQEAKVVSRPCSELGDKPAQRVVTAKPCVGGITAVSGDRWRADVIGVDAE